ncbi:MAG: pentapeptide repeat-containing protein [Armatimonadetes bacterium]|nr:pentapeptide repeat-containing protein [Armatimonadota bacterium]
MHTVPYVPPLPEFVWVMRLTGEALVIVTVGHSVVALLAAGWNATCTRFDLPWLVLPALYAPYRASMQPPLGGLNWFRDASGGIAPHATPARERTEESRPSHICRDGLEGTSVRSVLALHFVGAAALVPVMQVLQLLWARWLVVLAAAAVIIVQHAARRWPIDDHARRAPSSFRRQALGVARLALVCEPIALLAGAAALIWSTTSQGVLAQHWGPWPLAMVLGIEATRSLAVSNLLLVALATQVMNYLLPRRHAGPRTNPTHGLSDSDVQAFNEWVGGGCAVGAAGQTALRGRDASGQTIAGQVIGADVRGTDMRGADLSAVHGLETWLVGGANLEGIRTTAPLSWDSHFAIIDKDISNIGKQMVAMLTICAFAVVTCAGIRASELLAQSGTTTLPALNVQIPLSLFSWIAPFTIWISATVLNISNQRLWELYARLPAVLPDGSTPEQQTPQWLLWALVPQSVRAGRQRPAFLRLQRSFARAAAYWIPCWAILYCLGTFMTNYSIALTCVHLVVVSLAVTSAVQFEAASRASLAAPSCQTTPMPQRLPFWHGRRCVANCLRVAVAVCLLVETVATNRGALVPVSGIAAAVGIRSVIDVSYQDLSTKPTGWYNECTLNTALLQYVRPARLAGLRAPLLVARHAFLAEAELTSAVLSKSDLRWADLRGATLASADLGSAGVDGADAAGAVLTRARMDRATLVRTNLQGAHMRRASLRAANAHGANLTRTDMVSADLTGANLSGAVLVGASLAEANLMGADLRGADLTNVSGLTERAFRSARSDLATRLGPGMQWRRGAPYLVGLDLKRNVVTGDFTGADLTRADLTDATVTAATLVGARLTGANLTRVTLRDVDLRGAKGLTAAQLSTARLERGLRLDGALADTLSREHDP